MPIKTREEIEAKLVAEMVAEQNEITVFEPKTAIRGFITAVAGTIRELWNDLYRMQRKIFLNTSSGADLDELAAERGITRRGATNAGVLLTIKGSRGSVIEAGKKVKNPSTSLSYTIQEGIKLGENNPGLVNNDRSVASAAASISDNVWALCETPGLVGNSQVRTINQFSQADFPGVSSITNYSPARGGTDAESDGIFRERIRNYISILNQGTETFYESLCKDLNPRVLRVKARKDHTRLDSIRLIIVTADGSPLVPKELGLLQRGVKKMHRAFTEVTCENVKYSYITVKEMVKILHGYTVSDVFTRTADALADYFNFKTWEFGGNISVDNVFNVCYNVKGINDIDLPSFTVNSGAVRNNSASQIIYNGEVTTAAANTITDINMSFTDNSLTGKYIRITSGEDEGDIKLISSNNLDDHSITIYGTWDTIPVIHDTFEILELYRFTTRTNVFIDEDTLPYFNSLEMFDLDDPSNFELAFDINNKNRE